TGAASPPDEPARGAKNAMPQPAKTTTSRAGRDLRAAILVGAGIGTVLVVTLVFAPRYWVVHCAWAAAVASHEVVRRLREAGYVVPLIPLLVGGQATVWLTWPYHAAGALAGFGGTVVVCMIWRLFMQDNSKRPEPFVGSPSANYLRDASATVFLAAWVPLFASFAALLVYPKDGAGRVFCLMITVVASDVGGYAVGVLFGKHPRVPAISPKKSWEGFAGSLLFGITAATLTATFLADKTPWIGVLLGVVLVFTCTMGDLVESQVKRDLGIKDMGRMLPGHGGLMDRLDGVLPSAVAAWTVLTLVH
ncbi:MAG: phosphatidate cytidylyltransferase, partial [Mycobacterium sp.]